jgi:hypothetical protein
VQYFQYFKKIDEILNQGVSNSRVVKVVARSKPQVEDVVRSLSKSNFCSSIARVLHKGASIA